MLLSWLSRQFFPEKDYKLIFSSVIFSSSKNKIIKLAKKKKNQNVED